MLVVMGAVEVAAGAVLMSSGCMGQEEEGQVVVSSIECELGTGSPSCARTSARNESIWDVHREISKPIILEHLSWREEPFFDLAVDLVRRWESVERELSEQLLRIPQRVRQPQTV